MIRPVGEIFEFKGVKLEVIRSEGKGKKRKTFGKKKEVTND